MCIASLWILAQLLALIRHGVVGGCAIEHSLGKAWLETERVLTAGVARGITVRACERKAVTVQLWLPVASYTYTMIWQKEVVLLPSGGDGSIVIPLDPTEYIDITRRHRLAIQVKDSGSLPVSSGILANIIHAQLSYSSYSGRLDPHRNYTFGGKNELKFPYSFDLVFCRDNACTGVSERRFPKTLHTTSTTTSPEDRQVGWCGGLSLQRSRGQTWLETERVLTPGVAHFIWSRWCANTTISVQLWVSAGAKYRLVWHKNVSLDTTETHTVLTPLMPDEFVTITRDHRLAIQIKGDGHIPIAILFLSTAPQLVYSTRAGPFTRDSVEQFGDLPTPYQFDMDFCYRKEDCLASIAKQRTPDAPLATPSGGNAKKHDNNGCGAVAAAPGHDKVMLEKQRLLPIGMLKSMSIVFCDGAAVLIQLWDITANHKRFQLVWQKQVYPAQANGGTMIVNLSKEEQIFVTSRYRLALRSTTESGHISVPVEFSAANVVYSVNGATSGAHCSEEPFDDLQFPWTFRLRLCLNKGCQDDSTMAEDTRDNDHSSSVCDIQDKTGTPPVIRLPEPTAKCREADHDTQYREKNMCSLISASMVYCVVSTALTWSLWRISASS